MFNVSSDVLTSDVLAEDTSASLVGLPMGEPSFFAIDPLAYHRREASRARITAVLAMYVGLRPHSTECCCLPSFSRARTASALPVSYPAASSSSPEPSRTTRGPTRRGYGSAWTALSMTSKSLPALIRCVSRAFRRFRPFDCW